MKNGSLVAHPTAGYYAIPIEYTGCNEIVVKFLITVDLIYTSRYIPG
eukprot:SAG11_NODE_621_length_8169_cov_2.866914_14_plen_47_part_00